MRRLQTIIAASFGIAFATSGAAEDFTEIATGISSMPMFHHASTTRQKFLGNNVSAIRSAQESTNTSEFVESDTGTLVVNQAKEWHGRSDNSIFPQQYVNHRWGYRTIGNSKQPLSGYVISYHLSIGDVAVVFSYNPSHVVMISMVVM